jgi:hypothetical protein
MAEILTKVEKLAKRGVIVEFNHSFIGLSDFCFRWIVIVSKFTT